MRALENYRYTDERGKDQGLNGNMLRHADFSLQTQKYFLCWRGGMGKKNSSSITFFYFILDFSSEGSRIYCLSKYFYLLKQHRYIAVVLLFSAPSCEAADRVDSR